MTGRTDDSDTEGPWQDLFGQEGMDGGLDRRYGERHMENRRIVVTMAGSEEREGFFVPHAGRGEEVELAEDLAEALKSCFERPCKRLYVSLFSANPSELTSLFLFRSMKPSQYVVLVVDPAIRPMVETLGLADECLSFEG